ncbi:MAG: DUF4080 domain-containing protein [Bacteroidota bacterium]
MKVLLTTLNAKYIHLNLAIRLLYSLNKDKHPGLAFREFTIKEDSDAIALACKDYQVVTFSCYIWNITPTLLVAKKLKEINPSIKILLGGPEVSYEYDDIIQLPYIDYIIVGEGEIPMEKFLDSFPNVDGVPNLVFKDEKGKVNFLPQSVTFDLKNYADVNPYQFDDPTTLKNKIGYIETSRGCPYKCEFCLASLDNKVRYLPIETIKSNLLYLIQHGRVIKFLDRTFNVKRDFTIDMFDFILKHHQPGNIYQFEITADIVHPDIVKYIHEQVPPGVFRFEIGIQTVNQKANLEVSRKQNFEKTAAVIKQLDSIIEMHLDLIVGLPFDEWKDIKYSFESVFALHPSELQLGFLKFLRGTPVREKHEKYGYVFDPNPPYQIIKSDFLSEEELKNIVMLEEALEIFWNKKRAIHTLKYVAKHYSIFDFLHQLGVYFNSNYDFHQHTLFDVYDALSVFVQLNYSSDISLQKLVTIDYHLHYKVKPQQRYLAEVDKAKKSELILNYKLNHHEYRFVIFDLDPTLSGEMNLNSNDAYIVIQYTGTDKPTCFGLPLF